MNRAPSHRSADSGLDLEAPPDYYSAIDLHVDPNPQSAPPARRQVQPLRVASIGERGTLTKRAIERLRVVLAKAFLPAAMLIMLVLVVEFVVILLKPCWSSHPLPILSQFTCCELICIIFIHVRKQKRRPRSPPSDVHRLPLFYPGLYILAIRELLYISMIITLRPGILSEMMANCTNRNLTLTAHFNLGTSS